MLIAHALAAIFATVRLTEFVLYDRLADPLRRRLGVLGTCGRCTSVWAGVLATAAFFTMPWLNWPLALAWLYLVIRDAQRLRGRRVIDRDHLAQRISELATDRAKVREALEQTSAALQQQQAHLLRIEGAILELQEMLKNLRPATEASPDGHPVSTVETSR